MEKKAESSAETIAFLAGLFFLVSGVLYTLTVYPFTFLHTGIFFIHVYVVYSSK